MPEVLSPDIYDHMAPHYRAYSEQKAEYLNAVNQVILEFIPPNAVTMLDVGAGDGVRALDLAQKACIQDLTLLEPSAEMVKLCKMLPVKNVWRGTADDLPAVQQPSFDLITCLWNVMGHIPGVDARTRALRNMARLLAPHGRIILDVNNRHNSNSYGKYKVFGRKIIDALAPNERRGDVSFSWDVDGRKIPANGHLFTPAEMRGLFRNAGLRLTHAEAIDYKSGVRSADLSRGQMLFILEKEAS